MGILRVGTAGAGSGNAAAGTSATLAYTPVAAGHLLALAVGYHASTGTPTTSSVSDGTNTWAKAQELNNSSRTAGIWFVAGCAATAITITVTISTAAGWGLTVVEFSGVATSSPQDSTGNGLSGSSTSASTGNSGNTTGANDLTFAVVNAVGSGTLSFTSPAFAPAVTSQTNETTQKATHSGIQLTMGAFDAITGASGNAEGFSATISTSEAWAAVIANFKAAAVVAANAPALVVGQAVNRAANF